MEEQFRKIIEKELNEFYKPFGFSNGKKWWKYENEGFQILFLQTRKDIGQLTYCPQFRIYLKEVTKILDELFPENIINPSSLHNTGAGMAQTIQNKNYDSTQYNSYGKLNFTNYRVQNELQLYTILEEHKKYVREVVFPYFKHFDELDSAFNFVYNIIMQGDLQEYLSDSRQKQLLDQVGTRELYATDVIGNITNNNQTNQFVSRLKHRYVETKIWEKILKINQYFKVKNEA